MEEKRWLLAELHCHSTNSDGKLTPEEIVAIYEEKGYDILAITDHDVLTKVSSDKMIIIPACEWTAVKEKPFFNGHLLIYFLKEMPVSLNEAVSKGVLICVAHPITWPWWKKKIPPQVKGYESINGGLSRKFQIFGKIANKITSIWYGRFYKVKVAGGDVHDRKDCATVKCWIYAHPDLEEIKQALLEGNVIIEYRF